MNAGCLDTPADSGDGWSVQQGLFPKWIAGEDIRCDVDENVRPNAEDKIDEHRCMNPLQTMCSESIHISFYPA